MEPVAWPVSITSAHAWVVQIYIEGFIEISMGLFLAGSIAVLFSHFPMAIIGAMMFMVGIELTKFATDIQLKKDLIPMAVTVALSLVTNMAYGFLAGLAVYHLTRFAYRKKGYCNCKTIENSKA